MKHLLTLTILFYFQLPVFALDIDQLNLSEKLADDNVTFGNKTIRLPTGDWYLAGKYKGQVTNTKSHRNHIYTAYFAQLKDQQFLAGLLLSTNMGSTGGQRWTNDVRCVNSRGELYKNEFKGSVMHPECLLIYKNTSHLRNPATGNIYPQVQEWMRQKDTMPKGAFFEISYEVQVSGNMGRAQYFINTKSVASEELLIAYANELAERLRAVFTEREKLGSIPELPAK